MRALSGGFLVVVGLMNAACASDPAPPATFSAIYSMLFPRSTKYQCEFCHGLPANEVSNGRLAMGMDQATAYAALVAQPSTSMMCGGRELVTPGDPDNSLLYLKLTSHPPCGDQMPLSGLALTSSQLQMVRTWIANGAQDD